MGGMSLTKCAGIVCVNPAWEKASCKDGVHWTVRPGPEKACRPPSQRGGVCCVPGSASSLHPDTSPSPSPELGEPEQQSPVDLSRLSGADSCTLPLRQSVSSLSGVI